MREFKSHRCRVIFFFFLVVISTGESNPDLSFSKVHEGRYSYEDFIYFLILMFSVWTYWYWNTNFMLSDYSAWHRPNVNTRSSNYTTRVQPTRTLISRRKIFRFCVTTALSEVFLESQMVFVFYRCFRPITQTRHFGRVVKALPC